MNKDTNAAMDELDNGTYLEILLSYDQSILLPVDAGADLLKLLVKAIPLKRVYDKPPTIQYDPEYPKFKLTRGAAIKKERMEALLLQTS